MGLIKEFKEFALRGNVVDLAVGVVIGAAFGNIVNSLVKDVIMPPIGLVTSGVDFKDKVIVLKPAVMDLTIPDHPGKIRGGRQSQLRLLHQHPHQSRHRRLLHLHQTSLMNAAKRTTPPPPAPPAPPTKEEILLTEIRDALRSR